MKPNETMIKLSIEELNIIYDAVYLLNNEQVKIYGMTSLNILTDKLKAERDRTIRSCKRKGIKIKDFNKF